MPRHASRRMLRGAPAEPVRITARWRRESTLHAYAAACFVERLRRGVLFENPQVQAHDRNPLQQELEPFLP